METILVTNVTSVFEMAWYGETIPENGIICEDFPRRLSSSGIWEKLILYQTFGLGFWEYKLPNLEVIIFLVFIVWQFIDFMFRKSGFLIPRFTSMMLAGLVLKIGEVCMGKDSILAKLIHPVRSRHEIPQTLGGLAFTIFWFLIGVKMDIKKILRTEAKSTVSGIAAIFFPSIVGFLVYRFKRYEDRTLSDIEYDIMVVTQSLTTFSGITKLLQDLNMTHSELGQVAISTALVADLVGVLINSLPIFTGFNGRMFVELVSIIVFIIFSFKIMRPVMFWAINRKREGRPIDEKCIYGSLVLFCFSNVYFMKTGHYPAIGPFILGLAIPDGHPLGSTLVDRLECFNLGIILPLFLCLNMMKIDVEWLIKDFPRFIDGEGHILAAASLILLMFLVKFSFSMIVPYCFKMPLLDSFALSLILNHKGIVELSFYAYALDSGVLSLQTFSVVVLSILLNSLFIPIVIAFLYDPSKQFMSYQKRSLVHLKTISELKTMVCILRPDHITSMMNLLEASSQSQECPLACCVLHLVELSGQATPTIISHEVQKLGIGSKNKHYCSENGILSFQHFNRHVCSSVSIETFTSISVPTHMKDDICWLALDKNLTLILLPFHRTWSLDRTTIVSESEMIRHLNYSVLKQGPCSVGILIDRQPIKDRNRSRGLSLKVCIVFVGGRDDREALALAKRMAQNVNASLTVLHLIHARKDKESNGWDQMLDSAELKQWMRNLNAVGRKHRLIEYLQEEVLDGTETSMLLRSMASDYDLFLVGRNDGVSTEVTSGLETWSEFEELGIIGDFLASPDFPSRASVLIIQQQRNLAQN